MSTVKLHRRDDGVGVITFDTPDSKVNVLSRELFDEIGAVLDEIEKDDSVRACVLTSGKPGTFIAGARSSLTTSAAGRGHSSRRA